MWATEASDSSLLLIIVRQLLVMCNCIGNNNTQDSVYGALIVTKSLSELDLYIWWKYNSAKQLLTFRQSQLIWAWVHF